MEQAKGHISLIRKVSNYIAGYGMIRGTFTDLSEQLAILKPAENEYYQQLRVENRKASYLSGRLSGRIAASILLEPQAMRSLYIDTGVFHYPVLKTTSSHNVQLSISHTDSISVALAFPEEHPMGIDIEKKDNGKMAGVRLCLTEKEQSFANESGWDEVTTAFVIWTAKEALSKVIKTGLTLDFRLLEIKSLELNDQSCTCNFVHFIQYKAISFICSDHICSIVLPANTSPDTSAFAKDLHRVLSGI